MINENLYEEDVISKYSNWFEISSHKYLTEEFIREFKDKVIWLYISGIQKLSENFIIEFKDRVDWDCISRCQKLSLKFIKDNIDELDMFYLFKNENISKEIKQNLKMYSEIL